MIPSLLAQELNVKGTNQDMRKIYFSIGSGFPEFSVLRLGYQIDKNYSIASKAGIYYDGTDGYMSFGQGVIGLKVTKYFEETKLIINNVSFEAGVINYSGQLLYACDLTVGYESIFDTILYWACGISYLRNGAKENLFLPSIKLGLNLNF